LQIKHAILTRNSGDCDSAVPNLTVFLTVQTKYRITRQAINNGVNADCSSDVKSWRLLNQQSGDATCSVYRAQVR